MFTIPALNYLICRHVKRSHEPFLSVHSGETTCLLVYDVMKERELKLTKTISKVVVALYGIWIPVLVLSLVYTRYSSLCFVKRIDVVGVILNNCNCTLNPILYSYKNAEIQKHLKDLKKEFYFFGGHH